jgi:dolichol kinase
VATPHRAVVTSHQLALARELMRKALHAGAVVFPVAYWLGVPRGTLVAVLSALVVIALATEALRRMSPAGSAQFGRLFGTLTRGHEDRSITGATWLAVSCLAAVALLSRDAAIAALWCATVGDPAATIAGRMWALTTAPRSAEPGRKTFAGFLACAAVSFAGVWMLAGYRPVPALVIAAAAAAAEALPSSVDDNIRVAGAAGIVAQLLG